MNLLLIIFFQIVSSTILSFSGNITTMKGTRVRLNCVVRHYVNNIITWELDNNKIYEKYFLDEYADNHAITVVKRNIMDYVFITNSSLYILSATKAGVYKCVNNGTNIESVTFYVTIIDTITLFYNEHLDMNRNLLLRCSSLFYGYNTELEIKSNRLFNVSQIFSTVTYNSSNYLIKTINTYMHVSVYENTQYWCSVKNYNEIKSNRIMYYNGLIYHV